MKSGFTISEEAPDREYFTIVPNYIINHSTIWERDIYLIMKRIAGERGSCFASHQTIADKTGVSRPTISRTIKKLLKRGWIKEEGKVAGKTHPTKNYIIVDLWEQNSQYYREEKKRKLQNQSTQKTKDTSTTEPKIRKPQIYKEEKIEEDNINTKVLIQGNPVYGKLEINNLIGFLKEELGLPILDGTEVENRRYAQLAINKFGGEDKVRIIIRATKQDPFWSTNITSFKNLYYKAVQIVSSARSRKGVADGSHL